MEASPIRNWRQWWKSKFPLFFFCLLGCLNGLRVIDAIPPSILETEVFVREAPSPEERLSEVVDDISIVAGVVRGVSIAQSIQDGNFTLDQLAGELFLGPEKEMSSLEAVNMSELIADIEEIEKTVKDQCGNGCGNFDGKAVSDGFGNLHSMIKPHMRKILEKENAIEDIETVRKALHMTVDIKEDLVWLNDYWKSTKAHDNYALKSKIEKLGWRFYYAKVFYEKFLKILDYTGLPYRLRSAYVDGIDALLKLEPISFSENNDKFSKLKTELREILPKAELFSDALSTERINRINQRLDEVNPILDSAIRTSRHPLLRVATDFENVIRNFEKKFLDVSEETELKRVLEPIYALINDLKPLEASWNSTKIDGIEEKIERFRKNLDETLSGLTRVLELLPLEKCIDNLELLSSDGFKKLKEVKRKFESLSWRYDFKTNIDYFLDFYKIYTDFERSGYGVAFDESKIPRVQTANEHLLELVEHLEKSNFVTWLEDRTMDRMFSDMKMRPLIAALDCLEANNVSSVQERPVQMPSLSQIKPDDADLKAVVSAANAVKGLVDEWKGISGKTPSLAHEVEMKRMEFASNDTGPLVSAAEVVTDLKEIYEKRPYFEALLNATKTVEDEIASLTDENQKTEATNSWNEDVRNSLKALPEAIERALSLSLKSLEDVPKTFNQLQNLNLTQIDTRRLQKTLDFVHDSEVQKSLEAIGSLNLDHPDSKKTLNSASIAFISTLNYFERIEEAQRKKITRSSNKRLLF